MVVDEQRNHFDKVPTIPYPPQQKTIIVYQDFVPFLLYVKLYLTLLFNTEMHCKNDVLQSLAET